MQRFYVPILKSKLGEFRALQKLLHPSRHLIFPLFEITPIEWDLSINKKPKTIREHLQSFVNKAVKHWSRNRCFIDDTYLQNYNNSSFNCYKFLLESFAGSQLKPTIVIRLSSLLQPYHELDKIIEDYEINEVCLRITIEDVIAGSHNERIFETLKTLSLTPLQVHLLFDVGDSSFEPINEFQDLTFATIENISFRAEFKSITLAGSSFPATGKIKPGFHEIPRTFKRAYINLVNLYEVWNKQITINYGDYGIVSPEYIEFNPVKMSRSAIIRYTHDDIWFVAKGTKLKKSESFQQYYGLAKSIVRSPYFLGQNFSQGDSHLYQCSKELTSTGDPSVWSWVGNNHHFTKILTEFFSSSASSSSYSS